MTSSKGNIFRVTGHLCGEFTGPGEFPTQRPVTRSFDDFFDLRLNKRLSKQSWGWWFETLSRSLWRHHNETICSDVAILAGTNSVSPSNGHHGGMTAPVPQTVFRSNLNLYKMCPTDHNEILYTSRQCLILEAWRYLSVARWCFSKWPTSCPTLGVLRMLTKFRRQLHLLVYIFIQTSLKFVPIGPIEYKPSLVQILAWHRTGDKPLSEHMMA